MGQGTEELQDFRILVEKWMGRGAGGRACAPRGMGIGEVCMRKARCVPAMRRESVGLLPAVAAVVGWGVATLSTGVAKCGPGETSKRRQGWPYP